MKKKNKKYILWFKEISKKDLLLVGGKNSSLGEMFSKLSKKGISVPDGFALTAGAYWHYLKENGIDKKLKEIFQEFNPKSIESLQKTGELSRNLILKGEIPEDLKEEIIKAYRILGEKYGQKPTVGVRTSGVAEDTTKASFAGQFVIGVHNIATTTAHSFIIGNGQDAANKKNLVETSGSNFIITGSLYLTESRNISQQHLLMYDTASGEVTYFNRTATIITTDGNITVDVAKTSSVFWSASFSADRVMSCSFSNAAVGTSLRVMVRNAGTGYNITFVTETSTPNTYNYSGNNFANAAGGFFKSGSQIASNQASNIEIIKVSDGTYIGTILSGNPL